MNLKITILILGLFSFLTILPISKAEAAEKLIVNKYDTGSKIILSNSTRKGR